MERSTDNKEVLNNMKEEIEKFKVMSIQQRMMLRTTPFWKHCENKRDIGYKLFPNLKLNDSWVENWLHGLITNFIYGFGIKATIHFLIKLVTKRNIIKYYKNKLI